MMNQSPFARYARSAHGRPRIEPLEARQLLAAIIYVDQNAPGPVHDGTSWDNAYADLQSAMGAAGPGNEIRVADGTYAASAASPVQLKTGVAVLGGFAGSGAANPDARDIVGTRSVISGYTGLILGGATDSTAVFDGFAVASINFGGVSVVNDHGSPTIRNCTFTGGTGMNNSNSSPTVVNCLFTDTEYGYGGGAMNNGSSSSPTIINCQFINCFGNQGGALDNYRSSVTVSGSTFKSNNAVHEGQAIYNRESSLNFISCDFINNGDGGDPDQVIVNTGAAQMSFAGCTFEGNRGTGTGVISSNSSLPVTLENCTFTRNGIGYYGGALYASGTGPVAISNCVFQGNWTYGYGGALYVDSPEIRLTNCLFSGNVSEHGGGGAYLANGTATITNCTFSGNVVDEAGGAIELYNVALDLRNSILWGNSAADGHEIYIEPGGASSVSFDHSIVKGPSSGNSAPFVRLPNSGSDGHSGTPDDDYGDLRPTLQSGAVDGGDNSLVPSGITTDISGNPRFVDIFHSGAIVDIGAYEYQLPLTAVAGSYLPDGDYPHYGYRQPTIEVTFNGDLNYSTAQASDLVVLDSLTNLPIPGVTFKSASYDTATRTIEWTLSSPLPDGNYRAKILANSVADLGGNPLSADFTFDFFILSGDANHDRKIDAADLGILSANWQGSGKTFSQGDFNYDGKVDINDLYILASKWQQTLPPPPPSAAPASIGLRAPTRTATRMISVVQ